jgi:hypothetical protein
LIFGVGFELGNALGVGRRGLGSSGGASGAFGALFVVSFSEVGAALEPGDGAPEVAFGVVELSTEIGTIGWVEVCGLDLFEFVDAGDGGFELVDGEEFGEVWVWELGAEGGGVLDEASAGLGCGRKRMGWNGLRGRHGERSSMVGEAGGMEAGNRLNKHRKRGATRLVKIGEMR